MAPAGLLLCYVRVPHPSLLATYAICTKNRSEQRKPQAALASRTDTNVLSR